MPTRTKFHAHTHAWAAVLLIFALGVTWFAYAPGIGGAPHFDDGSNLDGLQKVNDPVSAFRFITSGYAGPLGRPLALASFVPQAYAWPHSTDVLLRTNILIHLLNGLLVTWFLYLLGRARNQTERSAALTAAGAGMVWMLLPMLASSSLFIVQRMTTLSALLALAGAIGYMYARQGIDRRTKTALFAMTLALGAGAALSALAKENGALLLTFILAVEITLLNRPQKIQKRLWQTWFFVTLVAPLAIIVFYLALALPYSESVILIREFTGLERLITQAEILWKYLYLSFFPHIPSLGPFHDDYMPQRSLLNPSAIFSIGGWITAICAALLLRRKAPLFSFALAWYLLGHLLESTTLSLELYFEHRNYLPLVGPVYAMVAGAAALSNPWRRVALTAMAGYIVILAGVLCSVTSLWGQPLVAAEMWQIYKPMSKRANVFLAQTLERDHDPYSARRVLEVFLEANPEAHGVRLSILGISCWLEPDADYDDDIAFLRDRLSSTSFAFLVPNALEQLARLVREERCPTLDDKDVYALGLSILENPRFNVPVVTHNVHVILSRITLAEGDFGATMMHIEHALESIYSPGTLYLAVAVLNSGGRHDISAELLRKAIDRAPPKHPLRSMQWRKEQDLLRRILEVTNAVSAGASSATASDDSI